MFIITGSYVVPIEEVERVLPWRWEYLDKLNKQGILVFLGTDEAKDRRRNYAEPVFKGRNRQAA